MLAGAFGGHSGNPPAPKAMSATQAAQAEARAEARAKAAVKASATATVKGPVLSSSEPVRLDIPKIGVHTKLLSLGLADDGSAAVPSLSEAQLASWYNKGPTPGSLGPSVLLGHVDTKSGPAVFYDIGSLSSGDKVDVTRQDGTVAEFKVDDVERFPKASFPTALVYGDLNFAGLRLITCGGEFDQSKHSYVDNTVVFGHLASSHSAS